MDLVAMWLHESPEETREEVRLALGLMADAAIEAGRQGRTAKRQYARDYFTALAKGYISSCVFVARALYGEAEAEELREALEQKVYDK